MKKAFFLLALTALLLLGTACGKTAEVQSSAEDVHSCGTACSNCGLCTDAACTDPACAEKCMGHHVCAASCPICSLCTDEACSEPVCREKCPGLHQEAVFEFSQGDYITTDTISIDTGTLVFDIGANIYVPGNMEETAQAMAAVMEQVSGLTFDENGYANSHYADGKVHVNVTRDALYAGMDWYNGLASSEMGNAYADPRTHALLSPGDLFLGNSKAAVHELSHVLMFRQSEWSHSQLLNEGFAEYTTYLTMQELDNTNMEAGFYLDRPTQCLLDMSIYEYDKLFEHPLEYWFENTFEYSGNANYAIGFRFMAYLHEVYGDYSKWITAFEETYSYGTYAHGNSNSSAARQIEVLKATYGADVLDNFYPWLQSHLEQFDEMLYYTTYRDMTSVNGINLYPVYNAFEARVSLTTFTYSDLYINLETVRKYVGEYKGDDLSNLSLVASGPVEVNLYQADGSYTTVTTEAFTAVSLEGIRYIKLVGTGTMNRLEISGSFTQEAA